MDACSARSQHSRHTVIILGFIVAVLLVGCAKASPTPTPAPVVPTPTTAPQAVATPTPTSAPAVVATPTPTRIPTPAPTVAQPKSGGTLRLWIRRDPRSWDTAQRSTIDLTAAVAGINQTLLRLDRPTLSTVEPNLAERWEVSTDGRTWTFHLRRDVKWHDGVPFTADDVAFYFDRVYNPRSAVVSDRRGDLASFQQVRALDNYTVEFQFVAFEAEAAHVLSAPAQMIQAKHVVQGFDARGEPVSPKAVGTGPFRFKDFRLDTLYAVERNPNYWKQGLPYLDGIVFAYGRDQGTMFAAFRVGRIDATSKGGGTDLTLDQVEVVKGMPNGRLVNTIWRSSIWAPNSQEKPWTDIRVRKAADLALDRDFICQASFRGVGCGDGYLLTPGNPFGLTAAEIRALPGFRQPKDQDLAEAKRLMAAAGYANGFDTVAKYDDPSSSSPVAEAMAFQLAPIGIRVKLQPTESARYTEDLLKANYQSAFQGVPESPWSLNAMGSYLSGTTGRYPLGNFSDRHVDDLLARVASTADTERRRAATRELLKYVYDQSYLIPVAWYPAPFAVYDYVQGFVLGTNYNGNNDHEDVWLVPR